MPVEHQVNITSQILQLSADQSLMMPVAVVGISNATGIDVGKVIRVRSTIDLTKIGTATAENTLLPFLSTLLRYGFGNIYVVQQTFTSVPLLEVDLIAGLTRLKEMYSLYQEFPRWIMIPGTTNSDNLVKAAIDTANVCDSMIALDFPLGTTTSQATTLRQGDIGIGIENARLNLCMPNVRVGALTEPLSIHFVRSQAKTAISPGFGHTVSNSLLQDVTGFNGSFRWSYTDPTADNQLLERQGIISINMNSNGYVLWGNRNGLLSPTNQSWNTFLTLNRIKQELDAKFLQVSIRFLGMTATASTAYLLEMALNNVLSDNMNEGNYDSSSRVSFNYQASNLAARKIAFNVVVKCNLPLEVINLDTIYTANV